VNLSSTGMNISVALCTHNGERYIGEQLRSILAQSVAPSEVIVSDDASSDRTIELVRAAMADHPSVSLTVLANATPLGVRRNFQQATLACSGDVIALSDQDDSWHPEKLERVLEVFALRPDVALVHTDARLVAGDGKPVGLTLLKSLEVRPSEIREIHEGQAFAALLRRNLVTGATVVFRSSLMMSAAPFPESWVHDEWIGIIAAATAPTELIERELVDYRQHGANQIGARKLTMLDKIRKLREPRQERNEHLVERAIDLTERLEELEQRGVQVDPVRMELARRKLAHERARLALPIARIRRVLPVLSATARGNYRSFGRGIQDVVRDIVQPAEPAR